MKIKRSYIVAGVIAVLIAAWILSGQFSGGPDGGPLTAGVDDTNGTGGPVASREIDAADTTPLAAVRARTVVAEPRITDLMIRGRTEEARRVEVKAESPGSVEALPAEKGALVDAGEPLCRLAVDAREAKYREARALMQQRWLEYDASRKLAEKGHRSETAVAASRAAYDAAKAQVKQTEIDIEQMTMSAPFQGILDERPVEVGDFMTVGSVCAIVVELDPLLVVGQVSEKEVGQLRVGAPGEAELVTGETVEGNIRFIAKTADPETRTFRVEMEVSNPDMTLPAGVTAQLVIPGKEVLAHRMSPAVLALDDRGVIGVRVLDEGNIVRFKPVTIIADEAGGTWVGGLDREETLITVGQEYVTEGQKVSVTMEGEGARS